MERIEVLQEFIQTDTRIRGFSIRGPKKKIGKLKK